MASMLCQVTLGSWMFLQVLTGLLMTDSLSESLERSRGTDLNWSFALICAFLSLM